MKKFVKKFKGFTLIELLAVIVILAIIAIIAIPIIMNIIEESRKNAAVASADGYIRAVNYKIAQEGIDGNIIPLGEYIIGENELEVDAKNKDRITGAYEIGEQGVLTAGLCIDNYSIEYSSGKAYYKKDGNYCGGEYAFTEPDATDVSALCEGENADSIYSSTDKYRIKTVEDLVCFSQLVNSGKNFSGKEIYLLNDINILNAASYKNSTTTKYGDINGNETAEGLLTELTTGSGFKPIGNKSNPFAGTFTGYAFTISNLMINRNTQYLGLFGYSQGVINGVKLRNVNVNSTYTGTPTYTGGLVGYNKSAGTVKNVDVEGTVTVLTSSGTSVGGVLGDNQGTVTYALFSGTVTGKSTVGGIAGQNNGSLKGVVHDTTLTGTGRFLIGWGSGSISGYNYNSTVTTLAENGYSSNGITLPEFNLTAIDGALDTYIGGDNDSDGYYFDYDTNGNITLYSTDRKPIQTDKLKGEGTQETPYLIRNTNDWKLASALATQGKHFSVTSDIDFTDKNFYGLGTNENKFNGTIKGNMHTISNISLGGYNYTSIFGYSTGTIEGFKLDNITVVANGQYGASLVGYNTGTIRGIKAKNISVSTSYTGTPVYTGGLVGYNKSAGSISSVDVKATVASNATSGTSIGGVVGDNQGTVTSALFSGTVTGKSTVGGISGQNNGSVKGVVYNTTLNGTGRYLMGWGSTGNTSGYNYNSTVTTLPEAGYSSNGVNVTSLTLGSVDGAIDTYIGGDNDSDGYYFDYDTDGIFTLYSVQETPIKNNLSGEGTQASPYLIKNADDWKTASTLVTQGKYFSITNDIDFTGKNFYVLGTNENKFNGNIKGNMHTISNITLNGYNYVGIFGYNTGTIEGLSLNNITVNATGEYSGAIAGYNQGVVRGIKARNISVSTTYTGSTTRIGGLVGYNKNSGSIISVDVKATVTAPSSSSNAVAGVSGNNQGKVEYALFSGTVTGQSPVGGLVGQNNGSLLKGVVYDSTINGTGRLLMGWGSTGNVSGYNYNSTVTTLAESGYSRDGTTVANFTLEAVASALDTTDSDSDGYYFTTVNNNIELVKAN